MMGSFSDEGEEFRFFDALEEVSSVSSSGSDCLEISDPRNGLDECASSSFHYDAWIRSPRSIQERRSRFLGWMELGLGRTVEQNAAGVYNAEVERVSESSRDEFCQSSMSNNSSELTEDLYLKENFVCRIGNSFDDRECNVDEFVNPGQLSTSEESINTSGLSPSLQRLRQGGTREPGNFRRKIKGIKKVWLSKLGFMPCVEDGQAEAGNFSSLKVDPTQGSKACRVRVHQCKKQLKELSALYKWQDIQAHKGSILAMKFSPDGQYLGSAGEDGIVCVWQVVEDARLNEIDIPEADPSCLYFTANHLSKLERLNVEKDKMGKFRSLRKASDSVCVVFPPKVFRILEKPLHEFHGHIGEILDLSWSKNNILLSASVDNTVRMWQVGSDHCLKVFRHNNYVTCVQFNPVDDNYFISGSIDGKVRVWAVPDAQVVDWTDIKEIITSVCYRPDGQGGVVGSITGNCRFYSVSDNHMQLDAQICLCSKKKSLCKRITGLQFLPEDPSKVMVTCADSQVRILHGNNVINKYRGLRNAGSRTVASLTSDGKRIVSATEDSTVYVWNSITRGNAVSSQGKSVRSCERFSTNASIAIPWCGLKNGDESQVHASDRNTANTTQSSSPAYFSLDQEFFLESFPKGSATWPEEKLPRSGPLAAAPSLMRRSQYKFLKQSCQSTSTSHAWGLVIVTAGWDGRIRSFHNYGLPVPI